MGSEIRDVDSILFQRGMSQLFQLPVGEGRRVLDETFGFVTTSVESIKRNLLQVPARDVVGFLNLDIDQNDVQARIMEFIRNSIEGISKNKISDGKIKIGIAVSNSMFYCLVQDNAGGVPINERESLLHKRLISHKLGPYGGRGRGLYELFHWAQSLRGEVIYTPIENGSEFRLLFSLHATPYSDIKGLERITNPSNVRKIVIKHYYQLLQKLYETISQENEEKFLELSDLVTQWAVVQINQVQYPQYVKSVNFFLQEYQKLKG